MMNKFFTRTTLFCAICLISFISCSKSSAKKNDGTIIQEIPVQAPKQTENALMENNSKQIDIDMTKMSGTMIYAEVFNMLIDPDSYRNKNIKVTGYFQAFESKETNEVFYAIIIPDATQCCQQGIEFILADKATPSKLPENGQEITISGTYCSIENELGVSYTYLEVFNLVF